MNEIKNTVDETHYEKTKEQHVRVNSKNSTHDILTRTVRLAEVHLAEMHHIFATLCTKLYDK